MDWWSGSSDRSLGLQRQRTTIPRAQAGRPPGLGHPQIKAGPVKVGLSFSRCVRDIVAGRVDMADVMIVIGGTRFDPNDDEHWAEIWDAYSQAEWRSWAYLGEDRFRQTALALYNTGRLHQWRRFVDREPGDRPLRASADWEWLDVVVPPDRATPAVAAAWQQYQLVAGLCQREQA